MGTGPSRLELGSRAKRQNITLAAAKTTAWPRPQTLSDELCVSERLAEGKEEETSLLESGESWDHKLEEALVYEESVSAQ
jgi:hypothetical protein